MNNLRKITYSTALAAALALGASSAARADTQLLGNYTFNEDGCSSGCGLSSYGTVAVTATATGVHVDVETASNVLFHDSGGTGKTDVGVYFSLVGGTAANVTLSAAAIAAGWSVITSFGTPVNKLDGFGSGNVGIAFTGAGGGNTNGSSLIFDITGASLAFADVNGTHSPDAYFVADIAATVGGTVLTGPVGATLTSGVPEPSTWGMMLLGFIGLGFAFRKSRRKVSFA